MERLFTRTLAALPVGIDFRCDVKYGDRGERPLLMHYARPRRVHQSLPAVVYIFGGGWRRGSPDQGALLVALLAFRGYFAASIDYRLSQEAKFPAQLEDCQLAIRYLRGNAPRLGLDPNRFGVFGVSAGGHLAALLGATSSVEEPDYAAGNIDQRSNVQAVVAWSGVFNFMRVATQQHNATSPDTMTAQLLGGPLKGNEDRVARADPATYLPGSTTPFLLVHGERDKLVPPSESVLLHEALVAHGGTSRLLLLPGRGHGFLGVSALRQTFSFLDEHLK